MKYCLKFCCLFSAAVFLVFSSVTAEITILYNGFDKLELEFSIDSLYIHTVTHPSGLYCGIHYGECVFPDTPGVPALPFNGYSIGIPPKGLAAVQYSVSRSEKTTLTGPIVPVPDEVPRWTMDPEAYAKVSPGGNPVSLGKPAIMRNLRVQRLLISPVSYDPRANTVHVIKKMRITITFPSAGKSAQAVKSVWAGHLLNYETARHWSLPRTTGKSARALMDDIFYGSVERYRVIINQRQESNFSQDGIYRITGAWLDENNIDIRGINVDHIGMYAATAGELPTAVDSLFDPGKVRKIPIQVFDRNGNHSFDPEDEIRFYGTGTSAWSSNTADSTCYFQRNRYTDKMNFWLVLSDFNPLRMPRRDRTLFASAPAITVSQIRDYFHMENNTYTIDEKGNEWFWTEIGKKPNDSATYSFSHTAQLNDAVANSMATLRFWGKERSSDYGSDGLSIKVNGDFLTVRNNGSNNFCTFDIPDDADDITILADAAFLNSVSDEVKFDVDGYTIVYDRYLRTRNERELFFGKQINGNIRYNIENTDGDGKTFFCYKISDLWNIVYMDSIVAGYGITVDDSAWIGNHVRFLIETEDNFRVPDTILADSRNTGNRILSHLRSTANRADYLIISPDSFISEAVKLADFRAGFSADSVDNPKIALLSDVFDEFSGGHMDPTAIRNCLYYAFHYWSQAPEMVVLFGAGNCDYKGYSSASRSNPLPPYIFPDGVVYSTDNFFVYLNPGEKVQDDNSMIDMALGRLPAGTIEDAEIIVEKIMETEDPQKREFGPWRQRIVMVADDAMQVGLVDRIPYHTRESEEVYSQIRENNNALEIKKVYLFDYTLDSKYEKPDATSDLISIINNGCILVYYVGHGAASVLADEKLLQTSDVDRLTNAGNYPLIFAASCEVGYFDHPTDETIVEKLVKAPSKGCIASIASTRKSSSSPNLDLAKKFYKHWLLPGGGMGSIGYALMAAKNESTNRKNKELYCLLGDPATRYYWNTREIRILSDLDSIKARQVVTVTGEVRKNGNLDGAFNGRILLQVYKPGDNRTGITYQIDRSIADTIHYIIQNDLIFSGQAPVKSGKFSQSFLVPTKIIYGSSGSKLTAFAWDDDGSAFAFQDNIYTGGTDSTSISDKNGPDITFTINNTELTGNTVFNDNAKISLPVEIGIHVQDSMGIDVTSRGPDEGLVLEIPDVMGKTNINSRFQYEEGDFRKGRASITFEEGSIPQGQQKISVTVRDGIGNLAKKSLMVEVLADSAIALMDVFNYPNPFSATTKFYYKLTQPADVTIKIFTRSGQLIRIIENADNPQVWDGRDQRGNPVSNNVYIYKIIAQSKTSENGRAEAIEKLIRFR